LLVLSVQRPGPPAQRPLHHH